MARYTEQSRGTFLYEISKGNVFGHYPVIVAGHNDNCLAATPQQYIWSPGGSYIFTTVGETVSIVSTSSEDDATPGGTGWRTCFIEGLDENYNEISEFLSLEGLTPVNTQNEYIFISEIHAIAPGCSVGSTGVNQGVIIGTGNTSGKTFFQVDTGAGINQQCFGVVPAGKSLLIVDFQFFSQKLGGGQAPDIELNAFAQPHGLGKFKGLEATIETEVNGRFDFEFRVPFVAYEKSCWWVEVVTTHDATQVHGIVQGFHVDNDKI